MEQHFELTYQIGFQSNNLPALQKFCVELMANSPEKIFRSPHFTSLAEKSLISIIKRDDLQMKESEVWEYVLKWGLAQNPTLIPDPATWTDDDFKAMENTLQHCLPSIRFFSLSSKEFLQKVCPYKKLFKHQLYEDLSNSYLNPDSEPTDNILFPRNVKIDGIVDSKIVNLNIVSMISRWLDKKDINSKFSHLRELYLPYKFKLLLRGSRDGFTPKTFHTLCDDKPITVTFIKVKGTDDEILGGYNPITWKSTGEISRNRDSFIFSFKIKNNFIEDAIISNIRDIDHAFILYRNLGPSFGLDLLISNVTPSNEFNDYDHNCCRNRRYEKKIRDSEDKFSIEDYEVFQIIR